MKIMVRIALVVISMLLLLMVLAALSATSAHAAEITPPSAYKSLQPFDRFAKGEGEGIAYVYKSRTKADLIALLRDKNRAKKEMRVKCEVLVRQMMEGHPALPFEGCEGAAKALESDDFTVVACRDEMFQQNWLTVTNDDGSAFGVWHRKCLPNEKVLVYKKDQPLISTTCLNVAISVAPLQVPPPVAPAPQPLVPLARMPLVVPPPVATPMCPSGFALVANAWSLPSFSDSLRKRAGELMAGAEVRDSRNATNRKAYEPDDVSRTIGGQLRREVKIRAAETFDVRVQLRHPVSLAVEEDLGVIHLTAGMGNIQLSDAQHQKIVETIWPAKFVSPAMSGGARRLWLFPEEWGNWCTMNVHGILP